MNEAMLLALPVVELVHDWNSFPVIFEAAAIVAILCALLTSVAGFRRTGIAPGPRMTPEGMQGA
jgi:hypothetical protein